MLSPFHPWLQVYGARPLELDAEAVPATEQQEREAEPASAPPAAAAAAGKAAAREEAAKVQVSAPRPHLHAAARPNHPAWSTPPPPASPPGSPAAPSQGPAPPPPQQQQQHHLRAAPQQRQVWDCSANPAAHAARMAAASPPLPGSPTGRPAHHRASWAAANPPTPFAAFSNVPNGGSPTQPRRPAFSLPRAQLPRSPFGAAEACAASAAMPIPTLARASADRVGSLHEVPSLVDWAALPVNPLGPSPERVPSLHDWMMPLAPPMGSLPRQPSLRDRPIPEAGIAPADFPEPSLLFGEQLGARPPTPHAGSSLNRPGVHPADVPNVPPAHPAAGKAWPGRRAAPGRAARGASVSPKRNRNSLDEEQGVFVGSFDEPSQPPKSPRLGRRAGSIGAAPPAPDQAQNQAESDPAVATSPVRAGSALDSGTGFADFHAVIDNIWAGPNDVRKPPAGGESPWVG